jgi:subtilase family serine protease
MQGSTLSHRVPNLVVTTITLLSVLVGMAYFNVGQVAHASGSVAPHGIEVRPHHVLAGVAKAGAVFGCQTTTPVSCFGPQQIRNAYSIQPVLDAGITGKGRTIVIVDAFQSPTIVNDLHLFDQVFGLNDPTLNIIAPDGLTPFDPNDPNHVGFAGEISLDVEWAHAVAPDATIDLVLAKSNQDSDILNATQFAVDHNLGDVISQSLGEGESCVASTDLQREHKIFIEATLKRITLFASSGDQGAAQPTCDGSSFFLNASSPASDPLVTAVGGTLLNAEGTTGAYDSEVAWNEFSSSVGSGGGFSTIYPKPFYQIGTSGINHFRGLPDISYNAGISTGVLAVWSSSGLGANLVFIFGGTSAGSPQWAGITALGNQMGNRRLGFLNLSLYIIGHTNLAAQSLHDITSGNNTFVGGSIISHFVTVPGFNATKGWDPVTGWGTPIVSKLLPILVQLNIQGTSTKAMSQLTH